MVRITYREVAACVGLFVATAAVLAACGSPGPPDVTGDGLRVVQATAPNNTSVQVTFSEAVGEGADVPENYLIADPDGAPLKVWTAVPTGDGSVVELSTAKQVPVEYALEVKEIRAASDSASDASVQTAEVRFSGSNLNDRQPPRVRSAKSTSNTSVMVTFSQPVEGGDESAGNPAHYGISASALEGATDQVLDAQSVLIVEAAEVSSEDPTKVLLTTLPQSEIRYTLSVTDVQDVWGNQVAPPDRANPFHVRFRGTGPTGPQTDSDGDGLSDVAEQRGWVVTVALANGETTRREVTSDPTVADTDGDGVSDKVEKTFLTDPRNPDTDGDDLSDDQELNEIYSEPLIQDTDEDGLPDGLEFDFFKTSPILADTDGDGIPDDVEQTAANRDPRSADLPRHDISIGEVRVDLIVDYDFTTERDLSEFETQTTSTTLERASSREVTTSDTQTTEWFARASTTATGAASYPGGFSASVEVTAEAGVGASGTFVQNETSKQSSREAYAESLESGAVLETGETETRTVSGANIVVPLILENTGDISFTMSDVELTALMADPEDPTRFIPIGTLVADDTVDTRTTYNLGTIDTRLGPFRFKTSDEGVNPDLVERLLSNPQGILVKVSNFSVTDEAGNAFTFQQQPVTERTAPIVIDFGTGEVERTWAAIGTGRRLDTDGDGDVDGDDRRVIFDGTGDPVGLTLHEALQEVMGLEHIDLEQESDATEPERLRDSYATELVDGVRTITRVREVANDIGSDRQRAWILLRREGYDDQVSVDDVVLSRGQGVTLAYVVDDDDDGVPRRIEVLYGSSDNEVDTDGDGRDDFDEINVGWDVTVADRLPYQVFSNPSFADTDSDGLDDAEEETAGTDPTSVDTDGDGACDGDGVSGCPVDEHPLDPTRSGRPSLLAEYLFTGDTDDTSGNEIHGQTAGAGACTALTSDRFGFAEQAYGFNFFPGTGQCNALEDGYGAIRAGHVPFSEGFALSAWIRVDQSSSGPGWIAGQHPQNEPYGEDSWARLFYGEVDTEGLGEAGRVSFVIPGDPELVVTEDRTDAIPEDEWIFYAVSVTTDGTSTTARLYRNDDGIVGETTVGATFPNPGESAGVFFMGSLVDTQGAHPFEGAIDDVRVFDGALSGTNVIELYEEGGFSP